ncbi:hypothetical protein [Piscinibacter sp. XHJ-5]|uniref:hypothetical protein n=1 Tax=Piscinibacter sp. XHJ-5 TaxID=3037797 RepID=UPI002452A3E4|nr:hypothetical protein [Piscinibacter sp. XHJ-5]
MRASLIRRFAALLLSTLTLALATADPAMAAKKVPPPPQIASFEMEPAEKVAAGNELFFRVEGTPGSRATVRVAGVTRTLVLQEVDDGVYEGSYTLRPNDRANANSAATVTLRRNGRSSVSTMARLNAAPVVVAAPQPQPRPQPLALNRFVATPVDRLEPGTELKFVAEGTPGARASFTIENVANVPMRETAPGRYEGSYTLKRLDKVTGGVPIVATLESNGQVVRSNLTRNQMLVDSRPPTIRNQYPRDNETVIATGPVTVSGTFDDRGGLGVDPKSVRITLSGRDVTAQSSISPDFFTHRSEMAPGRYVADVSARDVAGNPVRSTWNFVVEQQPTAAIGLPLTVTSHAPNAGVPAGKFTVRGKTAPFAAVDAEVIGVASVVGMVGVAQKLFNERITADRNGDFSFDVAPQMPVPGMRYEVNLVASANNQTKDTRLVLFQQR